MHKLGLVLLVSLALGPSWCVGSPHEKQMPEAYNRLSFDPPVPPIVVSPHECPGVVGRNCTLECQLHICQALADLYSVSNNASDPWDHEHGWEDSKTQSCKQLLAAHSTGDHSAADHIAAGQPAYCGWHGVLCCSAEHIAQEHCYLENSVGGINLSINNLNVSLNNPRFFGAIKALHDCGLVMLDLESNNIAGGLSKDWAQLKHLQHLNIGACWLSGTISEGLKAMENLTVLNLGNNWFNGTLPAWLPDLHLLQDLNLGSQFGGNAGTELPGLLGTIPDRIRELKHLRQLVLEANSLSGHLPEGLCSEDGSSLLVLNVRSNKLEGPAKEVEECTQLVQLDLSSNMLTGSLPASAKWEQLATYTMSHNRFSGTWPAALNEARILEYLDVGHNELTGLLPPKITLLSSLKSVKMSSNKLSGAVGEDLYYMPSLAVLDLSSNHFVGTTPVAIGLSYSLSELDLSNNSGITGMLPPQLGMLPRLQSVKVTTTHMSCAGIIKPYNLTTNVSCSDPERCTTPQQFGDPDAPISKCTRDQLLPCFLRFADYAVPREDSSNMKCQPIMRKPVEQAQQDCAGSGPQQLGEQATNIPARPTDRMTARWDIDHSYYQYQTCECLLGFNAVWDETGTVLKCNPDTKHSQHKSIIIAVAVAAAAVLAVALVVFMQYLRTRPRWLRERILQSKRSKGCPRASKPGDKVLVSILVTDVKDFSDLTRRYPELMNKAMGGHNNIMRKACHTHAGHVLDQEGDSWTIAFHEAEDAVAFSLQVQQAISGKVWTSKLLSSPAPSTTPNPAGSLTAQNSEASASSSILMLSQQLPQQEGERSSARPADKARGMSPTGGQGSASRLHGSFSATSDRSDEWSSSMCQRSRDCSFTADTGHGAVTHGDVEAGLPSNWQRGAAAAEAQHHTGPLGSRPALQTDDTRPSHDAGRQQQQPQHFQSASGMGLKYFKTSSQHSSEAAPASSFPVSEESGLGSRLGQGSASMTVGHRNAASGASRLYSAGSSLMHRLSRVVRGNSRSSQLPQRVLESTGVHELRLSVRIGIATGWLHYGSTVDNSLVTKHAKYYVSDVANGGQVLIDERTFKLVKHSLSALGTVDENGYNDKQLQQRLQARAAARMQMACAVRCCSRGDMADSFSSNTGKEVPHDYESDAIVVHMGAFAAPALLGSSNSKGPQGIPTTTDDSNPSGDDEDSCEEPPPVLSAQQQAAAARGAGKPTARSQRAGRRGPQAKPDRSQLVQLYSIAAPGMRRLAHDTAELSVCTAWCQPVRARPDWSQVQKDYFQAPGARAEDLAPSGQQDLVNCLPPLPAVTFVFAEVPASHGLSHKQHRAELHLLNKAIKHCMVQLMGDVTGGDGYICRCHEPDLKYMVAFRSPVRAVQWCLLMQEALMYMQWPDHILSLPGFDTVLDPTSGQLLFRGPRLRMGVAEGIPSSVSPDHMGHANYTGGAVNKAARFMDVAAHPGQLVCDIGFAQRCFEAWSHTDAAAPAPATGRQTWGSVLDVASPEPIPESSAATDWGDPQVHLMQLMALRSQSETSGHCRPATGLQGLRSRALHELWYQQQQLKQGQKELYRRQMHQQQQFVREQPSRAAAAAAADGGGWAPGVQAGGSTSSGGSGWHGPSHASHSGTGKAAHAGSYSSYTGNVHAGVGLDTYPTPPGSACFNPLTLGGSAAAVAPLASSAAAVSSRQALQYAGVGPCMKEPVTALYLGNFSFKGSGSYEMVQLLHGVLVGREFSQEAPKGKGMRLSVGYGEVPGLLQVQLQIPARVIAARNVYAVAADAAGAETD